MLEVMDEGMHEARHEGKYRRIELITGRRQRRNWTDEEKARILAESAEPDVNISAVTRRWGVNRGLLNVWRRDAGLTSQRTAKACAQQAMFVPVTVVGDRLRCIYWDGSGMILATKWLEAGKFVWPPIHDGAMQMSSQDFSLLLAGIDWTRVKRNAVKRPTKTG
jgi:transposase-like protein